MVQERWRGVGELMLSEGIGDGKHLNRRIMIKK
jgi:hypothetical protein